MSRTLIRKDIAEAMFKNIGLSRNESAEIVETILEKMSLALERGENVKISSFGTFSVNSKTRRIGRNPRTGEEVPITPRRVVTFRPSHILREFVNSSK
jgi:integration host factor subunit alpha